MRGEASDCWLQQLQHVRVSSGMLLGSKIAQILSYLFKWDAALQQNFWQLNVPDWNCSSHKGAEDEVLNRSKT